MSRYELVKQDGEPGIKHLACGRTSFHPKDVEHRYCGNCHEFLETPAPVDPTVSLKTALEACARNDKIRAAEEFEALATWLRKGGFTPAMDEIWLWIDAEFRDEG